MPRTAATILINALLALSLAAPAAAQDGPRPAPDEQVERGRQQYLRGDTAGAIVTLRGAVKARRDAAEAWYYLGLALAAEGDTKEARKSLEQALKLRPDDLRARAGLAYALAAGNKFSEAEREARRVLEADPQHKQAHFVLGTMALRLNDFEGALREAELALGADADYTPALLLKAQAHIAAALPNQRPDADVLAARSTHLRAAEESLARFLSVNPQARQADAWREQLEAVRVYLGEYDATRADRVIYRPAEVTERAVILSKPEPSFPEVARRNGTQGIVRLRLVLSADGTVKHILPVRTLPHGLTDQAVSAARKIKFTPAKKDGRPVSMAVTVEYRFDIY